MGTQQQTAARTPPTGAVGKPNEPGEPTPPQQKMPSRRAWLILLLVVAANYALSRFFLPHPDEPTKVPYTLFKEEAGKGNVAQIYSRGTSITGRFRTPVMYPRDTATSAPRDTATQSILRPRPRPATPRAVTNFATELPAFADPGLEALLIA